jgi:hypothetical protein
MIILYYYLKQSNFFNLAMQLNILLNVNNNVLKSRDKTMKNYPLKKFCLNSFMNVVSLEDLFFCFELKKLHIKAFNYFSGIGYFSS